MKSKKIIGCLIGTALFAVLAGCDKTQVNSVTALTKDSFISKVESDYNYNDQSDVYSQSYDSMTSVVTVYPESVAWSLDFFEFVDDASAEDMFKSYQDSIQSMSEDNQKVVNIDNGAVVTADYNNTYYYAARVGNTLVYSASSDDNKADVEALLIKLGYRK